MNADTPIQYTQEWNLSNLLGGHATHKEIDELLDNLNRQIELFDIQFPELVSPYQVLASTLEEAGAVIGCLMAQDLTDAIAIELESKHSAVSASLNALDLRIDQLLVEMSDSEFAESVRKLGEVAFAFWERRTLAKDRMSLDKELLANDLSVSGHTADTTLYYTLIGCMEFTIDGKIHNISQVENLLWCQDRELREKAFTEMERVFTKYESLFGQVLNKIIDFRLRLYKNRGWDDYLHESLQMNRMSKTTLDTMWRVISKNKPHLQKYLDAKAKLMGVPKLSFCDTLAPLGKTESSTISWDDSCKEIISQFKKVSPKLAKFSDMALRKGWIEALPGDKKRAGGFCTSMTQSKETRIFMSFTGSASSQSTLAHELGHAYHADVIYEKPYLLGKYPMNLAETASTMCEMIVSENAINQAKDKNLKLELLEDKLSSYMAYSMNLHMRFLFDTRMHEARQEGFLTPESITQLMIDAQKESYLNSLSSYFSHFWAYKMHFYFTDAPFYNWTYTFGYLFSLGLYTHLMQHGNFEKTYDAILRDTGSMSVEDLAKKHLNVDLSQETFWQNAIDTLNRDIDEFLRLAKEY